MGITPTETIQIEPSRLVSAAEQGSPAQGLSSSHGALYSPHVGPNLRAIHTAHKLRHAKIRSALSQPGLKPSAVIAPTPEPVALEAPQQEQVLVEPAHQPPRFIMLRDVQRCVGTVFKVTIADLRSPSRAMPLVFYRQIAMYLCKEITKQTLPAIGRAFGDRDHTTVLHAWRKISALRASDPDLNGQIEAIIALVLSPTKSQQPCQR